MGTYRILVTGSRGWSRMDLIALELGRAVGTAKQAGYTAVEVIVGDASGVDRLTRGVCRSFGYSYRVFEAHWGDPCGTQCRTGHRQPRSGGGTYCPAAGMRRNEAMVAETVAADAHAGLAFAEKCSRPRCRRGEPGHISHGTAHCIEVAQAAGITVREVPG